MRLVRQQKVVVLRRCTQDLSKTFQSSGLPAFFHNKKMSCITWGVKQLTQLNTMYLVATQRNLDSVSGGCHHIIPLRYVPPMTGGERSFLPSSLPPTVTFACSRKRRGKMVVPPMQCTRSTYHSTHRPQPIDNASREIKKERIRQCRTSFIPHCTLSAPFNITFMCQGIPTR